MKKPTEKTKIGFGKLSVSFRKSTGIESALEKIDKLMPDDNTNPVGEKKEKNLGKVIADLEDEAGRYTKLLTATIADQKEAFGKGTDSLYRDLKYLRSSLESVVMEAKRDLAKLVAAREIAESEVQTQMKNVVLVIKTVRQSLAANIKASTAIAQGILKNPTPANFNSAIQTAARNVTQSLNNIAKFTMPNEINDHTRRMREPQMKDGGVFAAARDLHALVIDVKDRIAPLLPETGDSPWNSSLSKMANHPALFDNSASQDDVIKGTKQFIAQLKEAAAILVEINRGVT